MTQLPNTCDVVIIGAGPSGAVAASLLVRKGHNVVVIEKEHFPRFSIGESLLPQSMVFLEEAGLLADVQSAGFQFKNGAAFAYGERAGDFNFEEKFTPGYGTTFQVERAKFDKLLADGAANQGTAIFYGYEIIAVDCEAGARVVCRDEAGAVHEISAGFVLDASGFGRVLPRLLELDTPSNFPLRHSIFTHIEDNISDATFDRDKILITVQHQNREVWFWLIPFPGGRCSLGVVAKPEFLESLGDDDEAILKMLVAQDPNLGPLLKNANFLFAPRVLKGYSCNVKSLYGRGFALLGNAGEFLDPVFSSGVTIALKSASLAANCLHRQLTGEAVDWDAEYAKPLMLGVETFRVFVESWYDTRLQDIIFTSKKNPEVKAMVCSILAGYAWDENNPYVAESSRRVDVLAKVCRGM